MHSEEDVHDDTGPRAHFAASLKLDPTHTPHFRRAARLAAVAARFPTAAVTFADAQGQQQIVTEAGLEEANSDELRRCCQATAARPGVHVIPAVLGATSAATSTSTTGPRFFAGIAIRVTEGVGVLCVMGPTRGAWIPAAEAALIEIHAWLEDTLEALRIGRVDHLTALANRRELEDVLDREWRRAIRDSTALSVLSIDIDHFKRYNDSYGHPRGDETLRAVAATLRSELRRAGDVVGRMGGEEFVACLPKTDGAGAQATADAMRRAVEALQIPHIRSPNKVVTVSIGCATARRPAAIEGGHRGVVAAADRVLYDAKACGRNMVVTVELSDRPSPKTSFADDVSTPMSQSEGGGPEPEKTTARKRRPG